MRILIAKKNKLNASSFAQYLGNLGHQVEIITSLHQTCSCIKTFGPDVVMLGYYLHPDGPVNWVKELVGDLPKPGVSYVLLVPDQKPYQIREAMHAGVKGFIHYDDDIDALANCIETIVHDKHYLSPTLSVLLSQPVRNIPSNLLTPSEIEIAKRVLNGQSTKETAASLFRSIETIQNHRKAIKAKFGISGGKSALLNYLKDHDEWYSQATS